MFSVALNQVENTKKNLNFVDCTHDITLLLEEWLLEITDNLPRILWSHRKKHNNPHTSPIDLVLVSGSNLETIKTPSCERLHSQPPLTQALRRLAASRLSAQTTHYVIIGADSSSQSKPPDQPPTNQRGERHKHDSYY